MLKGPALGAAIESARVLKGVNRSELARHFNVRPESTYDWTKHGRVAKDRLVKLFEYFSDVVGPEHWGLPPRSHLSQSRRLTGEIILAAYHEAVVKFESATGLNATSFEPLRDQDHADLLALALVAQLSANGVNMGQEGSSDGSAGTDRSGSATFGEDRATEVGREGELAISKRKKRAA